MKDKNGKKILAGLTSAFIFFGKNVYATSSTSSTSSGGKIGLLFGVVLVVAVLGLGYKMDKNSENKSNEPKEPKMPKVKKEKANKKKKSKEKNNIVETEENKIEDNDMPYEAEQNEKYVPEKVEMSDINESTEYEDDDSLYSALNSPKVAGDSPKQDFDSTMVFNINQENNSTAPGNKVEDEEPENEDYEIGDLNQKIDELDDLDDIDDDLVNKKLNEFEKGNEEVENPEEFLNNLKKYETNADDFAGFSVAPEKNDEDEEVASFSFGNTESMKDSEKSSSEHKKYTRKKAKKTQTVENPTPTFETIEQKEESNTSENEETEEFSFSKPEEKKQDTNEEPRVDYGFLNQMEQNLMKNQEERMKKNTTEKKSRTKKKE